MVLAIPGAFVLWLLNRKERSFSDILHDDPYLNYFVGSISLLVLIIFIIALRILFF